MLNKLYSKYLFKCLAELPKSRGNQRNQEGAEGQSNEHVALTGGGVCLLGGFPDMEPYLTWA